MEIKEAEVWFKSTAAFYRMNFSTATFFSSRQLKYCFLFPLTWDSVVQSRQGCRNTLHISPWAVDE